MGDAFVTVIKVLASLSALYMCLSPSTTMYKIHKMRSTGLSSIVPLVALWACNHMWLLYGYVTDDVFPLMVTYIVGDVTSVAFIAVYYRYTDAKRFARKLCGAVLLLNAVVAVYAVLGKHGKLHESDEDVKLVVGVISIASSVLLYASPFATIKHVVTSRSSESIPFTMVLVGLVNNALWIVYGLLIQDALLVVPTVINVGIGVVQFVLYFVYHPKRQKPGASVAAGVAAGGGGAIEIVTEDPPSLAPIALSSIQIDGPTDEDRDESGYVAVRTPATRHAHLTSTSGFAAE